MTIRQNLINKENIEKLLSLSITIITSVSCDNELKNAFYEVYDETVGKVDLKFIDSVVLKTI